MKDRIKDMIKFIKKMPIRKISLIASPIFFIILTIGAYKLDYNFWGTIFLIISIFLLFRSAKR